MLIFMTGGKSDHLHNYFIILSQGVVGGACKYSLSNSKFNSKYASSARTFLLAGIFAFTNVNLFAKPMVVQMFMIFLPHHRNRRIYMVPTDFFENAWIVKQTAPLHNDENAMFSH